MKLLSSKKYESLIEAQDKYKRETKLLQKEIEVLQDGNQVLNNKLQSYIEAQNKECKQGGYCAACIYAHKAISYSASYNFGIQKSEYYVCGYNACEHFEKKENNHE